MKLVRNRSLELPVACRWAEENTLKDYETLPAMVCRIISNGNIFKMFIKISLCNTGKVIKYLHIASEAL